MTHDFLLTSQATDDLMAVQDYIAQDDPAAAARVIDKCFSCFSLLADTPLIGHRREDITSAQVRFWSIYSYLIVYDPHTHPITILRVLSGYRDLASAL